MASALAFQIFFSLLPFFLLLVGVLGMFLSSQQLRGELIVLLRDIYPGLSDRRLVDELVASGGLTLGVGLVGTVWSVTTIHGSLDRALRAVLGGTQRTFVRNRVQGLLFGVLLMLLALVSFASSFVVQALAGWMQQNGLAASQRLALELLSPVGGAAAGFVLFYVIFLTVPRRRMSLRARVAGALTAALAWEVAKVAFAVLAREAGLFHTYGGLAVAAGLLTWIYLTAIILLVGAEVMKAWSETHP